MPDHSKKFYAVHKGRRPGIYTRWSGPGGAEDQVKGFAGAQFRGFATRAAAEHFLRTGQVLPEPGEDDARPGSTRQPAVDYAAALAAGQVVVFTDGASTGNPGPGGYGVVLISGGKRRELSGGFRCTTNNRMELVAVITALKALKTRSEVVVYTDSRYVLNGVTLGWARRWRERGWMRDASHRAENSDLWATLLDLLDRHVVEFRWVKGHASSPENERCDHLAVAAAHRPDLPPDAGFDCR
jgi:ribonuclease HI